MSNKKPYTPPQVFRHKPQGEMPGSLGSGSNGTRSEVEGQFGLHVAPDFTTVVDTNRRYVEVSDSFCRLLGYRREDLIGKRYDEISASGTNDIPTVYRLFIKNGYMHGLWMLLHRRGTPILVRYEAWMRPDCRIQSNMEVVRRLIY